VVIAVMVVATSAAQPRTLTNATPVYTEYEVKAEFIERFTRFVSWPDSAFVSASSSFGVCIYGNGPLAKQLERVVVSRKIKERPTQVTHVGPNAELSGCHILYVAEMERENVRNMAARTRGKPILSVGDYPGFAEEGLLINLIVDISYGFLDPRIKQGQ
jgi:hypothetical protein